MCRQTRGSVDSRCHRRNGLKNIYRANGVAGVAAALALKIPKVDKIVGPAGYIMAAQMYAQLQGVSVACFGPSECMIIADDTATAA